MSLDEESKGWDEPVEGESEAKPLLEGEHTEGVLKAYKFLMHPRVATAALDRRIRFLESKNCTHDDIETARGLANQEERLTAEPEDDARNASPFGRSKSLGADGKKKEKKEKRDRGKKEKRKSSKPGRRGSARGLSGPAKDDDDAAAAPSRAPAFLRAVGVCCCVLLTALVVLLGLYLLLWGLGDLGLLPGWLGWTLGWMNFMDDDDDRQRGAVNSFDYSFSYSYDDLI